MFASSYLAIDIGTHAVRAAIIGPQGDILHSAHQPLQLHRIDEHQVEQDPGQIVHRTAEVISRVLDNHPAPLAAGLAIQRSTVVAWDRRDGRPLSPALSWQDTRAADRVAALSSSRTSIEARSGLVLSPHYGASKLQWLRQHLSESDDVDPRSLCLSPLVSFVLHHLLEASPCVCDESNAGRTQLWNIRQRRWDDGLCRLFEVPPAHLPRVKPVQASYGCLKGTSVPLTAVCGDQNAAVNGAIGGCDKRLGMINIGSGAFALTCLDTLPEARVSRLLLGLANSDSQQATYVLEGTVNGAGTALSWFCQTHPGARQAGGEAGVLRRLPMWLASSTGVPVFINAIGGVGSPWWRTDIESGFILPDNSQDFQPQLEEGAVAVVESVVFLLAKNIEAMRVEVPGLEYFLLGGGLARLDGVCQRLADLTGLPMVRLEEAEATLVGAAWLAARGGIALQAREGTRFSPVTNAPLGYRYDCFVRYLNKPANTPGEETEC